MEYSGQLKYIGKWIALKRSGMSQAELAKKAGITQQQVSRIEAGENFTIITFLKILTALGETVELPVTALGTVSKFISDSNGAFYAR
jgi:transcriptional regulator with XRE-family HTH domain